MYGLHYKEGATSAYKLNNTLQVYTFLFGFG